MERVQGQDQKLCAFVLSMYDSKVTFSLNPTSILVHRFTLSTSQIPEASYVCKVDVIRIALFTLNRVTKQRYRVKNLQTNDKRKQCLKAHKKKAHVSMFLHPINASD